MSRGSSSGLDVAVEKIDTGASWPWNLSTVPTRRRPPIRRSIAAWISATWALYGATTTTSSP